MRQANVGDVSIGGKAKAWKSLHEKGLETPAVVSLLAQLAQLQLAVSEDFEKFFIRGQELLTRLHETRDQVSETFFNALFFNGLPMRYQKYRYAEKL